jgi:hypothetical protein
MELVVTLQTWESPPGEALIGEVSCAPGWNRTACLRRLGEGTQASNSPTLQFRFVGALVDLEQRHAAADFIRHRQ